MNSINSTSLPYIDCLLPRQFKYIASVNPSIVIGYWRIFAEIMIFTGRNADAITCFPTLVYDILPHRKKPFSIL